MLCRFILQVSVYTKWEYVLLYNYHVSIKCGTSENAVATWHNSVICIDLDPNGEWRREWPFAKRFVFLVREVRKREKENLRETMPEREKEKCPEILNPWNHFNRDLQRRNTNSERKILKGKKFPQEKSKDQRHKNTRGKHLVVYHQPSIPLISFSLNRFPLKTLPNKEKKN